MPTARLQLTPGADYTCQLKSYETTTYIYVTQQIIEATVAIIRGAAESLEDAKPLSAQGATIRRQLCTQDPDIVHPESTLHDMKQQPNKE